MGRKRKTRNINKAPASKATKCEQNDGNKVNTTILIDCPICKDPYDLAYLDLSTLKSVSKALELNFAGLAVENLVEKAIKLWGNPKSSVDLLPHRFVHISGLFKMPVWLHGLLIKHKIQLSARKPTIQ